MVAAQSALNGVYFLLPLAYPNINNSKALFRDASDWSYDSAFNWGREHPNCGGYRQSPIHIETSSSYAPPMPPIKFNNYDIPLYGNITLSNNGHSVEFTVPPTANGRRPFISGSVLKSKYEAVGVHFHWGSDLSKGSEHMIDNRRFDAEMHIVHKNVNYGTIAEAAKHLDGLTVLAIMFKGTRVVDRIYPGLNKIFEKLPYLVNHGSYATLDGRIAMRHLLGDLNTKSFFTYSGSLTTPGCSEAVTWHVFPEPLPISYEYMQKFWSIRDGRGNTLTNNFRPLQRRNGRVVLYRTGAIHVSG
ncbi:carbonic anhydrase 2-like [Stomoxys calcitrans]|uniref:carbonic anhydrase 2-like n=1 Tax=Stomoxys calcitrans TaxID=35570 RepID=UPI0027E28B93|nr:carbonic anhydrase 2-like [Stomoxys calcitrans]